MSKLNNDDLFALGGKIVFVGAATAIIVCAHDAKRKISRDEYKQKYHKCNVISVYDGEINIDSNQDTNKLCRELSYKIAQQDDEDLVIYVYSQDKNERDSYTKYIESKIYITDEGKVLFDKDTISDYDYYSYISNLEKDQSSNGQRVRVNTGKEN